MLLIDLNQILISGIMPQISPKNANKPTENDIRYMILNMIRGHVKTFKAYGEVVICCDNRTYWRKSEFPYYKACRAKSRAKSDLDWKLVFEMMTKFRQELKDHFPYKVIDVDMAEADDIIGTLVPRYAPTEKILILSGDEDFLQLHVHKNVKQYSPMQKKFLNSENPTLELKEKIIRGDRGDGVPNVLSPSDTFVMEIKQKSVTKGILEKLLYENHTEWEDETHKNNFIRNQQMIDLSFIPSNIKQNIITCYEETKPAPRKNLLDYMVQYKLRNLISVMDEF
jgi:5'-3' exonuclease